MYTAYEVWLWCTGMFVKAVLEQVKENPRTSDVSGPSSQFSKAVLHTEGLTLAFVWPCRWRHVLPFQLDAQSICFQNCSCWTALLFIIFNCVNALGSITYPTQNLFFVKDWAILMLLSALPLARLPRIFSSLFDHVQPYLKQRSSFEVASQWAFGWDWQCRRRTSCGMLLHDLNDVDMFAWHVACKKICRIWR